MVKLSFEVPYEKRILPHLLRPQAPQDELWLIGKGKEYVTINCDLAAALLKRVGTSSSILVPDAPVAALSQLAMLLHTGSTSPDISKEISDWVILLVETLNGDVSFLTLGSPSPSSLSLESAFKHSPRNSVRLAPAPQVESSSNRPADPHSKSEMTSSCLGTLSAMQGLNKSEAAKGFVISVEAPGQVTPKPQLCGAPYRLPASEISQLPIVVEDEVPLPDALGDVMVVDLDEPGMATIKEKLLTALESNPTGVEIECAEAEEDLPQPEQPERGQFGGQEHAGQPGQERDVEMAEALGDASHSSAVPKFSCTPPCTYTTDRRDMLKRHMAKSSCIRGLVLLCDFCGENVGREDKLRTHLRRSKCKSRHSCEECPQKFATNGQLKDHMIKDHSDDQNLV